MNRSLRACLPSCCLLGLVACSGGSSSAAETSAGSDLARVQGWLSSGGNLELAAAFLAGDPQRAGAPGVSLPPVSLDLRSELVQTADGVVRFLALESGGGVDPVWSPLVERIADSADAPQDTNGNGTNRDEVLEELRGRYVFRTNARLPPNLGTSFVLPHDLQDRIVGRPVSRGDLLALRQPAVPAANLWFSPGDLGAAISAWTRRAVGLLSAGRGDLYGRTGEEGMRGLLLLEQALAAERLVVQELAFDGAALGNIGDPELYDPAKQAKIFPARVRYAREQSGPGLPPDPEPFLVGDRGSNLDDQARLLRGFAELAWVGSDNQTNPLLRRLFEGDPFGEGPVRGAARKTGGSNAGTAVDTISWEKNIKGLLQSSCAGADCHLPGTQSGFSVATYDRVLRGGDRAATNPTVVPGKSRESLLWQIVTMDKPPVSRRMPDGGPFLPKAQTDLIADWIDQGALEKDPGQKDIVPDFGIDGVRVVIKNLKAFHLEKVSGAFVDRADLLSKGDVVLPGSAGAILQALAAVRQAVPELQSVQPLLESHALFVAAKLVAADGRVVESYLLSAGEASAAPASGEAAASLIAGLYEAFLELRRDEIRKAADRAVDFWVRNYLLARERPVSFPASRAAHWTPRGIARAVEALSAWFAATGNVQAGALLAQLWAEFKRRELVLAEWAVTGETLQDQKDDTDADGVPEVGVEGRPPLFATALENEVFQRGLGIPARPIHYARDILPTLVLHCGDCHLGVAKQGDFQCDTFADLFRGGDFRQEMPSVVPGEPEKSLFYRKLQDRPPPLGVQMPEGRPPVAPAFRALIRAWIEQGAPRG